MMEKLGNPVTVCEPKSNTPQHANFHMPSSEPMLNSWHGSAGDTTTKAVSKLLESDEPSNVAKLIGELITGVTAAVGEPTPRQGGNGEDGLHHSDKGGGSDTLIEGSGEDGNVIALAVEDGSGGSGSGEGRSQPCGNGDMALPLSPGKKAHPMRPRRKNKAHSPNKVGGSGSQEAHPNDQVSSDIERFGAQNPVKLLIFNVHGTLLDCSLLSEPNPNTSIRVTTRSSTCRMVFRPWLSEFIDKCFRNFRVAFWGIKSTSNMEDVVASMLRRFNGLGSHKPVFLWSAKECEEASENIGVSKWKKTIGQSVGHVARME
jgi:hypothetical protein